MATRLPIFGGDSFVWGSILNSYLSAEHDSTGSHSIINAQDIITKGPWVDVRALGWGLTDKGIQSAIDYANANNIPKVLIPQGTYTKYGATWSTITMKDHVILEGPLCFRGEDPQASSGKGAVLLNNDNVDTLTYAVAGIGSINSQVRCLSFEGSGSGSHITIPSGGNVFGIEHNSFKNKTNAIAINGTSYMIDIRFNWFNGQTGITIPMPNSSGVAGHDVTIYHNLFSGGSAQVLQTSGTSADISIKFEKNIITNYNAAGINIVDISTLNATNSTFVDNYFESNTGIGSWCIAVGGEGLTVYGNRFISSVNGLWLRGIGHSFIGPNTFGSMTGINKQFDPGNPSNTYLNLANTNDGTIYTLQTDTGLFSGQVTSTLATGTAPIMATSTTVGGSLNAYAATYSYGGTQLPNSHIVQDTCTLGTNCSVTLSGASVFTSSTSYTCLAEDEGGIFATKVVQSSGSAFVITGNGTDVIRYQCTGN